MAEEPFQELWFFRDDRARRVFMPFATYYQRYVDTAIMDIISGGFDYNSVIRRVVTQMTNSGLRFVDYATGTAAARMSSPGVPS